MPSLKAFRLKKISIIGILALCMLITACTDSSQETSSSKNVWQEKVKSEKINESLDFELNLQLPSSDWAAISQGLIPQTQDERWLILYQDGVISFYRSQTAKLIFQCSVEERNKQILISFCRVNKDPAIIERTSVTQAKSSIHELLSVLLGRPVH